MEYEAGRMVYTLHQMSDEQLFLALPHCVDEIDLQLDAPRYDGKVRTVYDLGNRLHMITSDRVSAFDTILGLIPYKGQVLNRLSAWWFERTADIIPNHCISVPAPNQMVTHKAEMLPVEVVVRGYMTGVTDTSIWRMYEQGDREPYGIPLPDGMVKNDPFPEPIITPTTKAAKGEHDEKITEAEIIERGLVAPELWAEVRTAALNLFKRGQELALKGELILVDTKYEFGVCDGVLMVCDEIHTPDSSRFWTADSYDETRTPQNFSKEFLREWYAEQGYTGHGTPPDMPDELRVAVAKRYIETYEMLTGESIINNQQDQ